MKLILQVLCPVPYELVPPDKIEQLTYIPYPDLLPGIEGLWEATKDNTLWRSSKCLGINFVKILKDAGHDINDYTRECTYTMSEGTIAAIAKDIQENYSDTVEIIGAPKMKAKILFSKEQKNVYEFFSRDGIHSILVIDPEPEHLEAKVLPCLTMPTIEVDVPGQSAVDYYTSNSMYVYTKEGYDEISEGLPELADTIKELNPNYHIIRWLGIISDETTDRPRPWRDKLENLKDDMNKILDEKKCSFLKEKKIRKLVRKYYGNF